MEFCWPISSVFSAPLLKANNNEENSAGPLFFNPSPETLVQLYPSPSHLPPHLPNLTLTSSSSPVPYSTTCDLISDNTLIHSDYQTHHNKFNNNDFKVTSLLDIESVSGMKNDAFVALSMEADRFTHVLASKELLLLCDVRNPKKPLLTWVHRLKCPNHISVMKLSELRSNSSEEEMYDWASKSGYCILLGSFFDGEFSITCYGPDYGNNKAHCLSKLPNFAWGLPSDISLSGRGCHCGTCFVREEFSKETLHRREKKKELVMGFGFLEQEMTSQLSGSNHFAGFYIIRLMSSGKLEVQRYSAAWKLEHMSEKSHKESIFDGEDNHFDDGQQGLQMINWLVMHNRNFNQSCKS